MMEINKLREILNELERPIFHSEADFQHSLAWKIKEEFPHTKIRLERPFNVNNKPFYLDIFLEIDGEKIGIELKYKTKGLNKSIENEEYNLKNQGAHDFGRYDFCKDIFRIEKFIENGYIDKGFVIFLTNDKTYLKESEKTLDSQFRLFHGKKLKGNLNWNEIPKWANGRGKLNLTGEYDISWEEHNEEYDFKILIVEIGNKCGGIGV